MNLKKSVIASSLAAALTLGAGALLTVTSSYAYDETSTSAINVDAQAVILKGYDSVAYFSKGMPTLGDKRFAAKHDGATYYFASAENLQKFQANPSQYAPQYGGYCAMGAALGKKLDVDPTQFKVVDGKLYLNVNADVFQKWSQDVAGNIQKAEVNWPLIKDKAANTL
ncbi:YHS domain-containing protein [Pseudomonas sp. J452]|uniref:YHS domain-containing (seleno)protein n=1 Tax=Pseudomonas sp. J452 TaxID=2898441 RepID=UPI0021ADED88|nr:YHS domain-containing (seleno)protein [Pseudomonas sp. J452]UUY07601.1 YHS domain-containing protein [Pseudomonas sp. J452]